MTQAEQHQLMSYLKEKATTLVGKRTFLIFDLFLNTGLRATKLANLKRSGKHKKAIESNGKIDRGLLNKVCRNAAVAAGIQMFGPHALRHYFATRLLRRGVPIAYVSKILGHSSIRVTEQFYQHFLPDFLDGRTEILCKSEANPKTYRGLRS